MNEAELEEDLSRPRRETIDALAGCPGDMIVLGAGGKMGPTLSRRVARAAAEAGVPRRVFAASRFSSETAERSLRDAGVETIRCDLLDAAAVKRLPDVPNVIVMAGQKFGTAGSPSLTWAMNTMVPAHCAERYHGARIVVFSTGNVYALTPLSAGGSRETDTPGPVGEYASSVLGRERIFEYCAARDGTRVAIVRLNYAIDLRYGVLTDIARKILAGEPIALGMGWVNVIWQGDANRIAIECLPHAARPPFIVNVTGAEALSVRDLAHDLGKRLGREPTFTGSEQPDALLSNTERLRGAFAPPAVDVQTMLDRVADWLLHGGAVLGKPTKFEARDGRF